MDDTAIYGFPFPEGTDSPSGATQIEALAQEVEDQLAGGAGFRSRGKSIVGASQTTTSGSFTLLGTPDRVTLDTGDEGIVAARFGAVAVVPSGCTMQVQLSFAAAPLSFTLSLTATDNGSGIYTTPAGLAIANLPPAFLSVIAFEDPGAHDVEVSVRRTAGASPVGLSGRVLHAYSQNF